MHALQFYAKLCAVLDGSLQKEMVEITIHDHVGKPARVTLSSCIPESGPEFDARRQLGNHVDVVIVIVSQSGRIASDSLLAMHGKVVEATTSQTEPGAARHTFTIEHCEPDPQCAVLPSPERDWTVDPASLRPA